MGVSVKTKEELEAWQRQPCAKCAVPNGEHSLSKMIYCMYGGAIKKDGKPLQLADAEDIVRQVKKRLR